ncbi:hypothetical protein C5167_008416 [Papaver somniferum]|uniref:Uncharacterized protein n=1 Tax=Papaver somniferum TaxID=3469 RepID=A0A4Y7JVJ6_PAPSO|nr:hypothetical protein C5167_008416 [Papaver somniferum]
MAEESCHKTTCGGPVQAFSSKNTWESFFLAQRKNWRKKAGFMFRSKMVEIHDISSSTDKETLLVNHIVTGSNGTDHNIDIPSKGRVSDDDDEIYNFYKEYAKKLGFPVHRRAKKEK